MAAMAELESFPWERVPARLLAVRRVRESADSMVAEVLVSDGRGTREAVLKVQRALPVGERARTEFQILSLLSDRFASDPGFGVPRPLTLHETAGAVLMEACRGRPLDGLVREARITRAPAARAALGSALRRTGTWLRLLQAHTAGEGSADEALAVLCTNARRHLEACRGATVSGDAAGRLARRLDDLAGRFAAGAPARAVGCQGDFWPGNVFASDDRIEVIDFEGYGPGLPYEDLAYFVLQLELFYAYPGLRRRFTPAAREFLGGYLQGETLDAPAWALCRLAKGLQMLARDTARGRGRGPRRWWRQRVLRRQVFEAARDK